MTRYAAGSVDSWSGRGGAAALHARHRRLVGGSPAGRGVAVGRALVRVALARLALVLAHLALLPGRILLGHDLPPRVRSPGGLPDSPGPQRPSGHVEDVAVRVPAQHGEDVVADVAPLVDAVDDHHPHHGDHARGQRAQLLDDPPLVARRARVADEVEQLVGEGLLVDREPEDRWHVRSLERAVHGGAPLGAVAARLGRERWRGSAATGGEGGCAIVTRRRGPTSLPGSPTCREVTLGLLCKHNVTSTRSGPPGSDVVRPR